MIVADPLREVRMAVRSGDFRRAVGALDLITAPEREQAEWLLLKAMTQWRLGEFGVSRTAALAARDGFRAGSDGDGEMRAENVAAAGAFALGNLDDAEDGFTRAHELATQRGDALLAARCANNLGNVAFYRGQHDVALGFYRLATAGFERSGFDHGLGEAWINQSIVARDVGRMREALGAAERALVAAEHAGSSRVIAQAHASIGEARGRLGDPRLGRVHLHRALQLARREADRLAQVEALRLLGNLDCALGDLEAADRFYEQARAVVEGLTHPWAQAELFRDHAACLQRANREDDARRMTDEAIRAFEAAGSVLRAEQLRSPV